MWARRRAAAAASVVTAFALASLGGCSQPPNKAPVLAASTAPKPSPTTPTTVRLLEALVPVPAGSQADTTNGLAARTTLDLDHFVDGLFVAASVPGEKTFLQAQGFTGAAETNWDAKDGTGAEVFLVGFRSIQGAQHYVESESASTSATTSSLAAVPGGTLQVANAADSYGDIVMQARFTVGDVAVDLHYYSHGAADRTGLAELAQAQYGRLKAAGA